MQETDIEDTLKRCDILNDDLKELNCDRDFLHNILTVMNKGKKERPQGSITMENIRWQPEVMSG